MATEEEECKIWERRTARQEGLFSWDGSGTAPCSERILPLKHLCMVAGWLQSSYQYQAGALLKYNQTSFEHLPLLWSAAAVIQLEESQRARTSPPSTETTAKPWPRYLSAYFPSVPTDVPTSNSHIPHSTQTFTQSFSYLMPSLKTSGLSMQKFLFLFSSSPDNLHSRF